MIASIIVILMPLVYFISIFHNHEISTEIGDWANFGDYIGGILNPIISFCSLFLLGYLTYLVTRDSIEESTSQQLKIKKMEAYDNLAKYFPSINNYVTVLNNNLDFVNTKVVIEIDPSKYYTYYTEIFEDLKPLMMQITEYHFFLSSFLIRYNHLFSYDFSQKDFKDLVQILKKIDELIREATYYFAKEGVKFKNVLSNEKIERPDMSGIIEILEPYGELQAKFLNEIKKELY